MALSRLPKKWGDRILENETVDAISNQSHYIVYLMDRVIGYWWSELAAFCK